MYASHVLSQLFVCVCCSLAVLASRRLNHHPLSSAAVCVSVLSGLMYEEEGSLIELMMCAIRQAAEATPPVGRTQGKKVVAHRQMHDHLVLKFMFCGAWGREKCHSLFILQMYPSYKKS